MTPRDPDREGEQYQAVSDSQQPVLVAGSLKPLPSGYRLWVAAVGPSGSVEYWPRGEVKERSNSWTLEVRPGLKSYEDRKRFAVFLVGPEGQKLIQHYLVSQRQDARDQEWPAMRFMTSDMEICRGRHEVRLK